MTLPSSPLQPLLSPTPSSLFYVFFSMTGYYLLFNTNNSFSLVKYSFMYVNHFLNMLLSLIQFSRIALIGIFVIVCLLIILFLPKHTILKKVKLTKQTKYKGRQKTDPTFYILCNSLLITFLILLFNKTNQPKETFVSCKTIKTKSFQKVSLRS